MGGGRDAVEVHPPDGVDVLKNARELLAHHLLLCVIEAKAGQSGYVADGGVVDHRRRTVAEGQRRGWYRRIVADERELIERIAGRVGVRGEVVTGVGDDAAVLANGMVMALDMLVDGVHFRRSTHSPSDIGHKALAVNLSDIAAMAADPVAVLIGLGVPPDITADDVDEMYGAMEEMAARYGFTVAGGDITDAPALTLAVTVTGRMRHGVRPVLRSGARLGDRLVITGALGGSAAGLLILDDPLIGTGLAERDALVDCHRRPTPLLSLGHHLADCGAGALMDISDGLLLDASRMARASGLRAEIELDAVPRAPGVDHVAAALGLEPDLFASTGGEDYALLAAIAPGVALPRNTVVVGRMIEGPPGVIALRGGCDVTPAHLGWEHGHRSGL